MAVDWGILKGAQGAAYNMMEAAGMPSQNEKDRLVVRDTFKRWPHPGTAQSLLWMGYQRDMVREEYQAVLELLDKVDESVSR